MVPTDIGLPAGTTRFPPDRETLGGGNADIYFDRGRRILRAEGLNPRVVLEFFARQRGILCGIEEATGLLRQLPSPQVTVTALSDGDWFDPGEVVMRISGPYLEFGLYETALLGMLSSQTGWATAAAACVAAASPVPVVSFGARHVHPLVSARMEYAAVGGGCVGCVTPPGTLPYALVLPMGGMTVELVERVRRRLDGAGHQHVKIFVSGGFGPERIERMRAAGAPVAKRGRVPGRTASPRLREINLHP